LIPITAEHLELQQVARDFLAKRGNGAATARAMLDETVDTSELWSQVAELGWLGLHIPEQYGGSGFGFLEAAVVVQEWGRALMPEPFVSTLAASAIITSHGTATQHETLLPGLAGGSITAGIAVGQALRRGTDGLLSGWCDVLGGLGADLLVVSAEGDAILIDPRQPGVTVSTPATLDPSLRLIRVTFDNAEVAAESVLPGAHSHALAVLRTLVAAAATGGAYACVESSVDYAKTRVQFGRTIGTFQAIKHHCANMFIAAEMAAAATWNAARTIAEPNSEAGLDAAIAAALAIAPFVRSTQLNTQIHGAIGYTWEYDSHLYLRRAATLAAVISGGEAAADVTKLSSGGAQRSHAVELPVEAQQFRADARSFVEALSALPEPDRLRHFVDSGYVMPHWSKPFGLGAGAVQQLVIEEELAGIDCPRYSMASWIMLTILQHGTEDQIERWIRPTLLRELRWCQMFSEPEAGSDAAALKSRAVRESGGWVVNGHKIWTTDAQLSSHGLLTVRTDPDAGKHAGITMMALDLSAPGVQIQPIRDETGEATFNEVLLVDVFIPDEDVIGAVGAGWKVARSTLGNERIGVGRGEYVEPVEPLNLVALYGKVSSRRPDAALTIGTVLAEREAIALMNVRRAMRAVAGAEAGPEGNILKLAGQEIEQRASTLAIDLLGSPSALLDDEDGAQIGLSVLYGPARTLGGGTSEVSRNQIAERMLGLPRDPLLQ
jgi:3-oxochol-4-en-24-oyl-CoA dehydrogenase